MTKQYKVGTSYPVSLDLAPPAAPKTPTTILCWAPGASEEDKAHDLKEVEAFIEHVKKQRAKQAKRRKSQTTSKPS